MTSIRGTFAHFSSLQKAFCGLMVSQKRLPLSLRTYHRVRGMDTYRYNHMMQNVTNDTIQREVFLCPHSSLLLCLYHFFPTVNIKPFHYQGSVMAPDWESHWQWWAERWCNKLRRSTPNLLWGLEFECCQLAAARMLEMNLVYCLVEEIIMSQEVSSPNFL